MVALWMGKHPCTMCDATGFAVLGAIVDPAKPSVGNRPGAHRTGFQRNVKVVSDQPLDAQQGAGFADCQHFGMGCWIIQLAGPVSRCRNHCPIRSNDHCANRHFAPRGGPSGFFKGKRHV